MKIRRLEYLLVHVLALGTLAFAGCQKASGRQGCIDRREVVTRHNVHVTAFDTLASLSVGNGSFAFTVDATGLQTFPGVYEKGVSLGTQSDWGWHSFLNEGNFHRDEAVRLYDINGKKVGYAVQWNSGDRHEMAANYFRINPHRLHLGMIGLEMVHKNGDPVKMDEITHIDQTLDLWQGIISSKFRIDGQKVEVTTVCHPTSDVVAVKINSPLVKEGRLGVNLKFPYPTGGHTDGASDWSQALKHQSRLAQISEKQVQIERTLDTTHYMVDMVWDGKALVCEKELHHFVVKGQGKSDQLTLSVRFRVGQCDGNIPSYKETRKESIEAWRTFWHSGGAVDFGGSTDARANELERRVVLSQYLTRIQCAGIYPPQETGLTFNSWFGKFHLEMDWWHGVHFALWGRTELLEKRLGWCRSVFDKAGQKAERQGYKGVRWAKMTSPGGSDSPSSIGEFLIWQQPHIIYFAELCYRKCRDTNILSNYADLVFATADFMASYAHFDPATQRYVLGPGLIPAQECFNPETTINPPFELAYWRWGLQTAIEWKIRLGQTPNADWVKVLDGLSPLAYDGDKYLVAESAPDTYTNPHWLNDHPMVLGAYGMLPLTKGIDTLKMGRTLDFIMKNWHWDSTWGWDYPMVAMNATRLGQPAIALDALLMDVRKNTYLKNGHNFQDERLRIYLPGNGGLLTAVAMMCAGYDGHTQPVPGFPADGSWNVKWEGLEPMP
ncbi:MAG: hypothetical protein QM786_03470 [Breznakibacter sp.]